MTREETEARRRDPRNYRWGGIYYCKADPRAIVPRRLKWMGWTVNFARPSAIPITLLLVAIVAVPVFIARAFGAGTGIEMATGAAGIAVLCLVCAICLHARIEPAASLRLGPAAPGRARLRTEAAAESDGRVGTGDEHGGTA